jgi:hypothetical protein
MFHSDEALDAARKALTEAYDTVSGEIRTYPTPISGCDAQFNRLLEMRDQIGQARATLEVPAFVPTPRRLVPGDRYESR